MRLSVPIFGPDPRSTEGRAREVRVHDFSVTLGGVEELTIEVADRLYESGCDDASPHGEGVQVAGRWAVFG